MICGISLAFAKLSPTYRQVTHILLTRAPLYYFSEEKPLVRLACVKRAASVRSEPGSNSPNKGLNLFLLLLVTIDPLCVNTHYLVFKERKKTAQDHLIFAASL